jgi:hypothetical protein
MHTYRVKLLLFLVLGFIVWGHIPFEEVEPSRKIFTSVCFGQSMSEEPQNQGETDIQWFREEMKISPKYMERKEGVLGMSWTHFFTMLFLVFFFVGTIAALFIRHKRTKELLNLLIKDSTLEK